MTKDAKKYRGPTDQFIDHLGTVVIQLSNVCAALKDKTLTEPSEIIRTALGLEADLISVSIAIPPSWSYTTATLPFVDREPITRAIWGDSYHIYRSIAASSMWNNYRCARILVHEIIIDAVQRLAVATLDDPGSQRCTLANQSRRIVQQLTEDICASVPFYLGLSENNKHRCAAVRTEAVGVFSTSEVSNATPSFLDTLIPMGGPDKIILPSNTTKPYSTPNFDAKEQRTEPQVQVSPLFPFEMSGAGGITLVWPLLIAANSGMASKELRKWIVNRLDTIGHSLGFNQALAAAQLLRDGMHTRAW